MRQSYHSYRRRVRLIECATLRVFREPLLRWLNGRVEDTTEMDAISDRGEHLEKLARRQFEQCRARG